MSYGIPTGYCYWEWDAGRTGQLRHIINRNYAKQRVGMRGRVRSNEAKATLRAERIFSGESTTVPYLKMQF